MKSQLKAKGILSETIGRHASITTMKEIGRELGISIATVSRALRNFPEVNGETRERVLRRAQELSYQPNSSARAKRAILEADLRIRHDIAVVGCGNVHYADSLRVPLTSIDQDSNRLGAIAARMALSIVKRRNRSGPAAYWFPPGS